MNFIYNALLATLGWLRSLVNSNVSINYASQAKFAKINKDIEKIIEQQENLETQSILLKNKIKEETETSEKYLKAIHHHNEQNNNELKEAAYNDYTQSQKVLNQYVENEQILNDQIEHLNTEIAKLEQAKTQAKNTLNKAANNQVVGKAGKAIEDIHQDLTDGSLKEVVEKAEFQAANVEVRRQKREAKDSKDSIAYQKDSGVRTLEDILNNP